MPQWIIFLILAIVAAIPLRFVYATNMDIGFFELVLQLFIVINLALMLFNLLPIPPLDGSAVLFAFLPPQTAWTLRPLLAQYGVLILILLIFPIFGGRSLLSTAYDIILFPLYGLLVGV